MNLGMQTSLLDSDFISFRYIPRSGLGKVSSSKESACQHRRYRFDPWVRKIPWRRAWQPTPVFLPGKFHRQRNLRGSSSWSCKESDTTEWPDNNRIPRGRLAASYCSSVLRLVHLDRSIEFVRSCNLQRAEPTICASVIGTSWLQKRSRWMLPTKREKMGENRSCSLKRQRRQWHPTPVLLPGKSHGQRSLVGRLHGVMKSWTWLSDFLSLFTFMHWKGNGSPLQCSCLENPRDGGAWWAAVYGVAQSQTWLKPLSSSSLKRERDGVGGCLSSDSFLSLTSLPFLVWLPLPVLEFPAVLLQNLYNKSTSTPVAFFFPLR